MHRTRRQLPSPGWRLVVAFAFMGMHPLCGADHSEVCLESLDHPEAWYVGHDAKIDQRVQWNAPNRSLDVDVVYARDQSADGSDPTRCETFTFAFRGVSVDGNGGLWAEFKGRPLRIAQMRAGLFGTNVVLERGVWVSVVQRDGALSAELRIQTPEPAKARSAARG